MLRMICGAGLLIIGLSFPMAESVSAKPMCYSARNCGGKVLSNRDCHNCKVKSNGKSWRAGPDGACSPVNAC